MRIPIRRFAIDQKSPSFEKALAEGVKYMKDTGEELEFEKIELRPDRIYRFWFVVQKELNREEE